MGAMIPPSRKSCYNFRVIEINRVVDGDTIDVTIDLGFDLYKNCLLYTSPSPRDLSTSRMPSSA